MCQQLVAYPSHPDQALSCGEDVLKLFDMPLMLTTLCGNNNNNNNFMYMMHLGLIPAVSIRHCSICYNSEYLLAAKTYSSEYMLQRTSGRRGNRHTWTTCRV